MDNSVGRVVTMKREDCDSNPNVTCSRGLHCAAYSFARNGGGDVVVDVKVNPKDVVAIPIDYDGQKMRVCEFKVVSINVGMHDTHLVDTGDDVTEADLAAIAADEAGATSEAGPEVAVEIASGLDFSKPQNTAESEAAARIDTRQNHKAQKRDARGHFIPSGKKSKPKGKRIRASKKKRPAGKKK
jgi:hypothetical protein